MSTADPVAPPRQMRPIRRKATPRPAGADPIPPVGAPSPPARPPRQKVLDPLSAPFLILLGLGFALAVAGQVLNLSPLTFLGPVACTLAYPVYGIAARFHERASLRERFADNAYYLGFIFTQIALVVGFALPMFLHRAIHSDDVLRMFGVAIGASMIGLLARTLLVQTGLTVDENADLVEREVETLAQEVETLARGVSSRTRNMLSELDGLSGQLGASRELLGREITSWGAGIGETLRGYDAQLKAHAEGVGAATEGLADAGARARSSILAGQAELVAQIRAAGESVDRLQSELQTQVGAASRGIVSVADTFTAGAADVNRLQEGMRERMAEAAETVRAASASLSAGLKALEGMSHAAELVGALDSRVSGITADIDRFRGHVDSAAEAARRAGDEATQVAQATAAAAGEEVRRRAEGFARELDESARLFEETLGNFRRELERVRL